MRQNQTIRKFVAALLLLVFTFSATPKTFLHSLFASHTDEQSCHIPLKNAPCLHEQGFHCNFNNLVVAAPYISADLPVSENLVNVLHAVYAENFSGRPQLQSIAKESRGPPKA